MPREEGPSPEEMGIKPEKPEAEPDYIAFAEGRFNQPPDKETARTKEDQEKMAALKRDLESASEAAVPKDSPQVETAAGTADGERLTAAETSQTTEETERAVAIAEGHFKKLEEDLAEAEKTIDRVASMPAGSREKYDAAIQMRDGVDGIIFADATVESVLATSYIAQSFPREQLGPESRALTSKLIYSPEVQSARKKLEDLRSRHKETVRKMMDVWGAAKQEYEGKLAA